MRTTRHRTQAPSAGGFTTVELLVVIGINRCDQRIREYKSVSVNVKQSGSRDEIEAAVLRVALDKLYEEPPVKRSVYLWSLVKMQQAGGTGTEGIGLPSPQQLQKDVTRVVTRPPPQTVAKMGQFVQDLQEQRKRMGVPNPY